MKYKVNIKETEEGYSVWVPGLPGCSGHKGTQKKRLYRTSKTLYRHI